MADSAGTFVITWTDGTTRTLNALTSPPGGGFGPAVTLAPNVGQINGLQDRLGSCRADLQLGGDH